jgi:pyrophosphatase PpaX
MKLEKITTVIWDLDGTILDTTDVIIASYKHAFKTVLEKDISDDDALSRFGRTLYDAMGEMCPERAEELINAYRDHNHEHHDDMISPFPGVLDALANVHRRGFLQFIVTSKTEWLSRHGLRLFDLEKYFDGVIGYESSKKHKPDPEPLLVALEKAKAKPDEAIYIGDSVADSECAANAGVPFVSALWGPNPKEMKKAKAVATIYDPRDILNIIHTRSPKII